MSTCTKCEGTGICFSCGGVPIKRNPDGSGWECTACNKTGYCSTCKGAGTIPDSGGGDSSGGGEGPIPIKVISTE